MTEPNKTPEQLAEEHWNWLEGILLEEMRMKMKLYKDAFVHGYKHGQDVIPPTYIVDGNNIMEVPHDKGIRPKPFKK